MKKIAFVALFALALVALTIVKAEGPLSPEPIGPGDIVRLVPDKPDDLWVTGVYNPDCSNSVWSLLKPTCGKGVRFWRKTECVIQAKPWDPEDTFFSLKFLYNGRYRIRSLADGQVAWIDAQNLEVVEKHYKRFGWHLDDIVEISRKGYFDW